MEGELYCTVLEDLKHWRINLAMHLAIRYGLIHIGLWSRLFLPFGKKQLFTHF